MLGPGLGERRLMNLAAVRPFVRTDPDCEAPGSIRPGCFGEQP
jgi:hypothetical protein